MVDGVLSPEELDAIEKRLDEWDLMVAMDPSIVELDEGDMRPLVDSLKSARAEIARLRGECVTLKEAGAHMAHTLDAIYRWWEMGENVLDENAEWARDGLEAWRALSVSSPPNKEPNE